MVRFVGALLALVVSAGVNAATCTWTGAGADAKWSSSANWNNCGGAHALPINGDTLAFPEVANKKTNTNDLPGLQLAGLLFNGLNYDIDGNAVTLTSGITVSTPIAGFTDKGPRFRPDITLNNAQTILCQLGTFVFLDGTLDIGANTLTIDSDTSACSTGLRGAIVGSGSIEKYGNGSLFLSNDTSSYTGVTSISGGTLSVNADHCLGAPGLGASTLVQPDGTLLVYGDIALPETIYINGGELENFLGNNTINNALLFSSSGTVSVDYAGDSLTLNGAYDSTVTYLMKYGPGTLILNGIIEPVLLPFEGVLELDGTATGTLDVASGVTLTGVGTMGPTTQLEPGSKLKPGTPGKPGTISGNFLSWVDPSQIYLRVGKRADSIKLTGTFAANGAGVHQFVFVDGDTPPKVGEVYTVAEYASATGFSASALNDTYAYIGTGAGDTLLGTFSVGATKMTFTVNTVVSDLLFRNDFER